MVVLGIINLTLVAIAGMYDFWRWEYNYGHNLNPDAPIIVPGMTYQPPLLGCKTLLNIEACSIPHFGAILLFVAVGILAFILYTEKKKGSHDSQCCPIGCYRILTAIRRFLCSGRADRRQSGAGAMRALSHGCGRYAF